MDKQSGILRDLSELSNDELVNRVLENYRFHGLESVLPKLEVNDEATYTLNNRLQRLGESGQLSPAVIEEKIFSGFAARFPDKPLPSSLDVLVNRMDQTITKGNTLNEFGLNRTEQLLFLRGIVIATKGRYAEGNKGGREFSDRQKRLMLRARDHIMQIATCPVRIPKISENGKSQVNFANNYSAAYLANAVFQESFMESGGGILTTSIRNAMSIPIAFGRLRSGDQTEKASIFPAGELGTKVAGDQEYVPRMPAELDQERIKELRKLQGSYGDEFTVFRYYETVKPFQRKGKKEPTDGGTVVERHSREDDNDNTYVVLEIEQPTEEGVPVVHVVAENPRVGNACYALREEVIDEWERLLGIRLTWTDILSNPRNVNRQMGTRDFRHNKGSDVPRRVKKYLEQDPASMITESFARIFDKRTDTEDDIFDDNMRPTSKNVMPTAFVDLITHSETLRELWPFIRQYGYIQTYQLIKAVERGEARDIKTAKKSIDLRTQASDLWEKILRNQRDELGF